MAHLLVLALALFAGLNCANAATRIVGGSATTIDQFPSVVQVEFLGLFSGTWSQSCGGVILNTRYIVSAASCFNGTFYDVSLRRIRAGSTTRNDGGTVVTIDQATNNPTYGTNEREGDISVILLSEALTYSTVIQQTTVVAQDFAMPDNVGVSYVGWGATSYGGSYSDELVLASVFTVNNAACQAAYLTLPDPATVTETMICAGNPSTGGADACRGDAGGPLFYESFLIGIVSWGHDCGNATFPGVNTAVSSYTDWIVAQAV